MKNYFCILFGMGSCRPAVCGQALWGFMTGELQEATCNGDPGTTATAKGKSKDDTRRHCPRVNDEATLRRDYSRRRPSGWLATSIVQGQVRSNPTRFPTLNQNGNLNPRYAQSVVPRNIHKILLSCRQRV